MRCGAEDPFAAGVRGEAICQDSDDEDTNLPFILDGKQQDFFSSTSTSAV